jgi:hypothetical protein
MISPKIKDLQKIIIIKKILFFQTYYCKNLFGKVGKLKAKSLGLGSKLLTWGPCFLHRAWAFDMYGIKNNHTGLICPRVIHVSTSIRY